MGVYSAAVSNSHLSNRPGPAFPLREKNNPIGAAWDTRTAGAQCKCQDTRTCHDIIMTSSRHHHSTRRGKASTLLCIFLLELRLNYGTRTNLSRPMRCGRMEYRSCPIFNLLYSFHFINHTSTALSHQGLRLRSSMVDIHYICSTVSYKWGLMKYINKDNSSAFPSGLCFNQVPVGWVSQLAPSTVSVCCDDTTCFAVLDFLFLRSTW